MVMPVAVVACFRWRHQPHWLVVPRETAALAKEFIEDAFRANGGAVPDVVHADRGTSMTSKPVAQLLADLNIVRSHSRPRVSNDNPYSEANFKTSSTARSSPTGSAHWPTPAPSASSSSPTTTPPTGTPASGCSPPPPSTTAPPRPSAPSGPQC
jgi:putative transposase